MKSVTEVKWEVFHDKDGPLVRIVNGGPCVAWPCPAGNNDVLAIANLIAQAPALLSLCREMELFIRVLGLDSPAAAELAESARALTAKAAP